jgi:hypothetical protein
MKTRAGILVPLLLASAAFAQTPTAIVRHSFDSELHGWTGIGINCRASIAAGSSFNGVGALKFEYDVKQGSFGMLAWQPASGALAGAGAFRFWLRTDQPTAVAFIVQERGGGRYMTMFAPPKGKWQKVEIAVADLVLSEGPADPKDADGLLDLAQVEAVSIGDVAQLVAQAGNRDIENLLGVQPGPRTLLLDDFTVTSEKLAPAVGTKAGEVLLDTFARPQIGWIATGNAVLSRLEGQANAGSSLQASYRRTAGQLLALVRLFPKGSLKGMNRVTFAASAQQPTTLVVQFEEAGGGKFNTLCTLADPNAEKTFTLELAGLSAADDSTVKDRAVRPELITQVVIIDASALAGAGPEGDNVLVIRGLKGVAAKPQ